MVEYMKTGDIGNYYGCLEVKKEGEKYYWSIENWDGYYWEEITEKLYSALVEFETNKTKED